MGVVDGGAAGGGPAGVADTQAPGGHAAVGELAGQVVDLALALDHRGVAVVGEHGDAGRVVAAVFEAAQALQQDWGAGPRAGVADDSAHVSGNASVLQRATASGMGGLRSAGGG